MQRVGLINGKNITNDSDITTPILASMTQGIIEGFGIVNGYLQQGKAVVKCRRTNGPELMAVFESDELVAIPASGNKSVYIQIDQAKIDNGGNNNADGSGIGSIVIGDSFPITEYNWIELYSIVDGSPVDERKGPRSLLDSKTSNSITEALIDWEGFVENGKIYQYTIDNSRVNYGGVMLSNGSNNIYVGSGEIKTGLVQSDGTDKISSKNGVYIEETGGILNTTYYLGSTFINGGTQIIEVLQTEIKTYNLVGGAFNFDSGYTNGPTLNISDIGLTESYGLAMNDIGTKMFVYGITDDAELGTFRKLYEYTLSTPFNISTATLVTSIILPGNDFRFCMSLDGSYIYTMGQGSGDITVHALTTPWDLSTFEEFEYTFNINNLGITPFSLLWEDSNTGYFLGYGAETGINIIKFSTTTNFDLRYSQMIFNGMFLAEAMGQYQLIGINGGKIYSFGDYQMMGEGEIREYIYTEMFDGTSLELIS